MQTAAAAQRNLQNVVKSPPMFTFLKGPPEDSGDEPVARLIHNLLPICL